MFGSLRAGETHRMSEREDTHTYQRATAFELAGRRGTDDRRGTVRPGDDPAPVSPPPDEDAVRKGEDILERVKPY
jgi:hypothetical protein